MQMIEVVRKEVSLSLPFTLNTLHRAGVQRCAHAWREFVKIIAPTSDLKVSIQVSLTLTITRGLSTELGTLPCPQFAWSWLRELRMDHSTRMQCSLFLTPLSFLYCKVTITYVLVVWCVQGCGGETHCVCWWCGPEGAGRSQTDFFFSGTLLCSLAPWDLPFHILYISFDCFFSRTSHLPVHSCLFLSMTLHGERIYQSWIETQQNTHLNRQSLKKKWYQFNPSSNTKNQIKWSKKAS